MNGSGFLKIVVITVTLLFQHRASAEEYITDQRFGKLTIYSPQLVPGLPAKSLVLFISGDGGWQNGVVNMARYLAKEGALVVGIDAKFYNSYMARQSKGCLYPAADFEQLSMSLQRKYNFQTYKKPILVGYSYGATMVYALLAQAPAGTFGGGIALGFCPDIDLPHPLCKGTGLTYKLLKAPKTYYLNKVDKLHSPFVVLNGVKDQTCNYQATADFLQGIDNASLTSLPKVGHGFSIADNWLPAFRAAYQQILQTQDNAIEKTAALTNHLNTKLPVQLTTANDKSWKHLLFFISGDGGWTSFDQGLAQAFATKNVNVIGLDAQKYFWNKKSPEETAKEIENVLSYYLKLHPELQITVMGYSFGACIAPFVINRLTSATLKSASGMVMLSPDRYGDFEIHVADMLSIGGWKSPYDVVQEVAGIKALPKLCIFESSQDAKLLQAFARNGALIKVLPGGHHFNNDFQAIVNLVQHKD